MDVSVRRGTEFHLTGGTLTVQAVTPDGKRLRVLLTPAGHGSCPAKLPRGSRVQVLDGVEVTFLYQLTARHPFGRTGARLRIEDAGRERDRRSA